MGQHDRPGGHFLFIYRALRSRQQRRLKSLVKKVSALPEVRAIVIRDENVTVAIDKSPAKTYIRITSLIDEINEKRLLMKPMKAVIKDDLSDAEFHALLRRAASPTPGTNRDRRHFLPYAHRI